VKNTENGTYKVRAKILIRLKNGIADPQGAAVGQALTRQGTEGVTDIRIGKLVDVTLSDSLTPSAAEAVLQRMCADLLANPVMENFEILIEPQGKTA
jgi:phosphoribosylformylglycinamidine synthase subunit PurS